MIVRFECQLRESENFRPVPAFRMMCGSLVILIGQRRVQQFDGGVSSFNWMNLERLDDEAMSVSVADHLKDHTDDAAHARTRLGADQASLF